MCTNTSVTTYALVLVLLVLVLVQTASAAVHYARPSATVTLCLYTKAIGGTSNSIGI